MTDTNERAQQVQKRINDLFHEWRRDPANFTFCRQVRSIQPYELTDRRVFSIDDGRGMLDEIARNVCGDRWEYLIYSRMGGDPYCVVTLCKGGC